jgi:hypothetical protein
MEIRTEDPAAYARRIIEPIKPIVYYMIQLQEN